MVLKLGYLLFILLRTKDAAEKLSKSSGVDTERLKQQAAAAVSQAHGLAKETVQELLKKEDSGSPSSQDDNRQSRKDEGTTQTGQTAHTEGSFPGGGGEQERGTKDNQKSSGANTSGSPFINKIGNVASAIMNEMRAAVLPEAQTSSALRGAAAKAGDIKTSDSSALIMKEAPEEASWQRQWRQWSEKLNGHPFFQSITSIKDSKVVTAGRDAADSIRERWETSDSPFVHRIQDATDAFFAEGEAATALREIRARDPSFDMVNFLQYLRGDVPLVIGAYLKGDEEEITAHCTPEMIERLTGIIKAQKAAGLVPDPTLLDNSDVELVDVKMLDDNPIVVVQFTCQQINCTRDSLGNVVEGGPDEVHRVYYYWALQQEPTGYIGEDGASHPPRWQLREMLIRGMHHLL